MLSSWEVGWVVMGVNCCNWILYTTFLLCFGILGCTSNPSSEENKVRIQNTLLPTTMDEDLIKNKIRVLDKTFLTNKDTFPTWDENQKKKLLSG